MLRQAQHDKEQETATACNQLIYERVIWVFEKVHYSTMRCRIRSGMTKSKRHYNLQADY